MSTIRPAPPPLGRTAIAAARRSVQQIVRRLVPSAADFCLVHLSSHGAIKAVAGAHASRDGERVLLMLMRSYRIAPDDGASGVASVMRTRRPLLRTAIQIDAAVVRRGFASAVELHRQLAPRSALVVPILTPFAVIGALTLCYSHSGRTYTARNIRAAERVAERIAQTLVPSAPDPLRALARLPRQGTTVRRRVAPRT
jgi:GAF domain-containing protein